jgi:hypothetical protein
VAVVRSPWPHQPGPSRSLERHNAASALTPAFAPISCSLHAQADEPSCHRRRALPRGRVHSPSHHRPLHHVHSPPPPHAPCRPSLWSNRARVRAHCRLLPARSSLTRRRPHGHLQPALLSALPSHLALVPPSPSPVDASMMTLPGNVFLSRRNTAAHHRDMAAADARTWPCSSTSPRSSLVASFGPPRL